VRSFLLPSLIAIGSVAPAYAQIPEKKWIYGVDANGVRSLHLDENIRIFGKEIPVRLRFICRPDKRGVIGVELIVAKFERLPQFHFKEFDEWEQPDPKTADIKFVVTTKGRRSLFHDCPNGWPSAEIPGGFTFSAAAPIGTQKSIPRQVIDALAAGAESLEIIVSDKKHPPKQIRAYFSMAGSDRMLKSLTEGIK
jgi:hypothetical protein